METAILTSSNASNMVAVIAPATLSAGYTFTAQVDGRDFLVTVPHGGVQKGQQFRVPYPTTFLEGGSQSALTKNAGVGPKQAPGLITTKGRWTTGLLDCCGVFCNCMFWQSWCCNPILFGQLAQRMNLGFCGDKTGSPSNACSSITLALAVYLCLYAIGLGPFIWPIWLIYTIILVMNVRTEYRRKYEIGSSCCDCCNGRMDDFCCALWCPCCVGIQMARQTHDEKMYPYNCCSRTGLPPNAPEIV